MFIIKLSGIQMGLNLMGFQRFLMFKSKSSSDLFLTKKINTYLKAKNSHTYSTQIFNMYSFIYRKKHIKFRSSL
jgi:hypothetical protein